MVHHLRMLSTAGQHVPVPTDKLDAQNGYVRLSTPAPSLTTHPCPLNISAETTHNTAKMKQLNGRYEP